MDKETIKQWFIFSIMTFGVVIMGVMSYLYRKHYLINREGIGAMIIVFTLTVIVMLLYTIETSKFFTKHN